MTIPNPFRYFGASPEANCLAVVKYIRLLLRLRNVEDLLHERGVAMGQSSRLKSAESAVFVTTNGVTRYTLIAFGFQTGMAGVSSNLASMALSLSSPTVIGTLAGLVASQFVAERIFKWLTVAFLIVSATTLIVR
jgi:hypothetical protein